MKNVLIIAVASVAVLGLSGCMGKGVGKGKGPVAVEQPVYQPAQETFVTKG